MPSRTLTNATLGGALLTILVLGLSACSGDDDDGEPAATSAETTGDTAEAESATVFEIEEGDCLVGDPVSQSDEVAEVPTVGCDEPHGTEVFLTYTIDTEQLPSAAEMETIVQEQCLTAFEDFVGMPYEESALEVTWLEPTPESWEQGDRELVCMITDPAGDVTGSLEGANR